MVTFEEFLTAELPGLARFAGALTGDRQLAEDVLSDALLAVMPRWRRIERMERPAAYVRQAVVNTYLSERRKASRRRTDPTSDADVFERGTPDMSEAVAGRDEAERLLARLTPQQRTAMVLRYLLDQDDPQIAEALNCSAATVRSHLSQARAALRLSAPSTLDGK